MLKKQDSSSTRLTVLTEVYLFLLRLSRMKVRFICRLTNSKYRGGALLFLKTVMNGLLHSGHFIATSLEMSGFTAAFRSAVDVGEEGDLRPPVDVSSSSSSSSSLDGLGRFKACFATCFAYRARNGNGTQNAGNLGVHICYPPPDGVA